VSKSNDKKSVIKGSRRDLEVTVNDDGKTELWVRPPSSENGYWIEVSTAELNEALKTKS
jgi:hypothetical protein